MYVYLNSKYLYIHVQIYIYVHRYIIDHVYNLNPKLTPSIIIDTLFYNYENSIKNKKQSINSAWFLCFVCYVHSLYKSNINCFLLQNNFCLHRRLNFSKKICQCFDTHSHDVSTYARYIDILHLYIIFRQIFYVTIITTRYYSVFDCKNFDRSKND